MTLMPFLNIFLSFLSFEQLRKPVSTLSIPSMKTGLGNRDTNRESACNEEAGLALVGVRSEYPRYRYDDDKNNFLLIHNNVLMAGTWRSEV
jgi:hypothetical protein